MSLQNYSTVQAAKYLKMSIPALKYHIYESKQLTGQMIGNSLAFTKQELDEFLAKRRPQGRPPKISD